MDRIMKPDADITSKDIHELVDFLPRLRSLNGHYLEVEDPPSRPQLKYHPVVEDFFYCVAKPCWTDPQCSPLEVEEALSHPGFVETADLGQLRSLLTWCVRGELVRDGHWNHILSNGTLFSILERLQSVGRENGNGGGTRFL